MEINSIFALGLQYAGFLGITTISVAATAFALFKWLGGRWLESKFAERMQNLKAEQDRAIRLVQSTIDREIHRAKKLYDNEFTALSESWRMLHIAFSMSESTIGSMTANVAAMNIEELDRFLTGCEMEQWRKDKLKALTGSSRQDEFRKWSEWQRAIQCEERWRECQQQIDSMSIFFPQGFTEVFREISQMILDTNIEFKERIQSSTVPQYSDLIDRFESVKKLRKDGRAKKNELEGMVRNRLWSVAKEGP